MASTLECKRSSVPGRNPKSTASSVEASSELGRRQHRLDEMERALTMEMALRFTGIFKALGFKYVALDLEGYRQGSLNEVLNLK